MPKRRIDGLVVTNVYLRLSSEHGGERRLGIKVDCEYAVAFKGKEMRKMRGRGGLGAAAFEIDDRDDLKVLALAPMRKVSNCVGGFLLRKEVPELVHLLKRINTVVIF